MNSLYHGGICLYRATFSTNPYRQRCGYMHHCHFLPKTMNLWKNCPLGIKNLNSAHACRISGNLAYIYNVVEPEIHDIIISCVYYAMDNIERACFPCRNSSRSNNFLGRSFQWRILYLHEESRLIIPTKIKLPMHCMLCKPMFLAQ